jgi:hypothetical protein
VTDGYGDEVPGPLVAFGEPFPGWLQDREVREAGTVVVREKVLYVRPSAPALAPSDVVEVAGERYAIEGDAVRPVRPSGRGEFVRYQVERVTRGAA